MPPACASLLSPLASPFFPSTEEYPSFTSIYNDGMPAGVVVGSNVEHEILHNIPDEAIDEAFPPNAEDAAELDAVDEFVKTMANLALLEEIEEKSRTEFCHVRKRWEARREEGLKGRPNPALGMIKQNQHGNLILNSDERHVVKFNHLGASSDNIDSRLRAKNIGRQNRATVWPKSAKGLHKQLQPIQQPRKHN